MIESIRRKFTEWYVEKGYKFGYNLPEIKIIEKYPFLLRTKAQSTYFDCPVWVKPILFLFSPSIYFMRKYMDFWRG